MGYAIFDYDPSLQPFEADIDLRMNNYKHKKKQLLKNAPSLCEFANGHEYFGFHKTQDGWYYREWAPAADEVYLTGDMNNWQWLDLPLQRLPGGVWEIFLQGQDALYDGCHVKTIIRKDGELFDRIPLYAKRVVQDPSTHLWCAQVCDETPYKWKHTAFVRDKKTLVYECHIGMAQDEQRVGTFEEFRVNTLPRIKKAGYTVLQIMAIMEHPYYGSFGYQVSNFFAVSSRFGKPNDLKRLIDDAHGMGLAVLLDVVHSHAVRNTQEGINKFDGTTCQFFHEGERGEHPAWDTKLFNYDKNEVLHFLLSNLKFWLTEYHFDGFRFDGVTSMIYRDHGLGAAFTDYSKYFSLNTDTEAITYLQLANELIREVNPNALTIAEDMSAMPGMCLPIKDGGVGFDFRLAMGLPDLWIKLIKTTRDEDWNMWHIWHELTSRRPQEKYIAYAESHDQALVGDKTIIFRLCDSEMYTAMSKDIQNPIIDRGIALHKMIRFISLTAGGEGYLNFMGNEFGHPEWIDFPREGNHWSHFYCRRQWHLADNGFLKYEWLNNFDRAMIDLAKSRPLFEKPPVSLFIDEQKQVLVFERAGLTFVFNFHPVNSYEGYILPVLQSGKYQVVLSTDESQFGGTDRVSKQYVYVAKKKNGVSQFPIYVPSRCAFCLKKVR